MPEHLTLPFKDPALAESVVERHLHSAWQDIKIARHPRFGLQLILDNDLQYSSSDALYSEMMVAPVVAAYPVRRVGIMGGGDGGVLAALCNRFALTGRALQQACMVDIDGAVIACCREAFPHLWKVIDSHPEAQVIEGDAFAWLSNARDYDAIIYDLTMDPVREGQSRDDFLAATLAQVAQALRPGGLFSMQCCGLGYTAEDAARHDAEIQRLTEALRIDFTDIRTQTVCVPSFIEPWTFLSARRQA